MSDDKRLRETGVIPPLIHPATASRILMSQSDELHIAPGPSAGGCMQYALNLPAGILLDNQDLHSIGPLPPLHNVQDWTRIREEYLRTLYPEFEFSFKNFHRDLLTNTQRVREANSVTLWIGTGLAEQLLLTWIVQLFRVLRIDPKKLRIIQFSHDAISGDEIQSVGILKPEALCSHPPPFSLDQAAIDSLDEAWLAVTANEPGQLLTFLNGEPGPLPFLKRSLHSLMFRFPDVETGLSRWENELLQQVVEKGPRAVKVIGFTMVSTLYSLDWVGDAWLFARLRKFADRSLRQPLILLNGDPINMRKAEVELTEAGKNVLARKLNAVTANGIDDWVCGIHLDSQAGRVWFQRDGVLVENGSASNSRTEP